MAKTGGARWAEGSAASLETISAKTSRVHVRDAYSQSNLLLHLEALSVGGHQSDGTVVSHLAVFSKSVDLAGAGGFAGGALLGEKARLKKHARDAGVRHAGGSWTCGGARASMSRCTDDLRTLRAGRRRPPPWKNILTDNRGFPAHPRDRCAVRATDQGVSPSVESETKKVLERTLKGGFLVSSRCFRGFRSRVALMKKFAM